MRKFAVTVSFLLDASDAGAGLSACSCGVGGTVEGCCCCWIPPDKEQSLLRSPDTNAESTSLSVNKGQTCNLRNGLIKAQISMEKYRSNIKEPHKTNWPRVWQNPEAVNSYCFLYWGKEVCTCFNNWAFNFLEQLLENSLSQTISKPR